MPEIICWAEILVCSWHPPLSHQHPPGKVHTVSRTKAEAFMGWEGAKETSGWSASGDRTSAEGENLSGTVRNTPASRWRCLLSFMWWEWKAESQNWHTAGTQWNSGLLSHSKGQDPVYLSVKCGWSCCSAIAVPGGLSPLLYLNIMCRLRSVNKHWKKV